MTPRGYSMLGWMVWKIAGRVVQRKLRQNRIKLIAAGVVAAVIVGGAFAGMGGGDDDE